MCKNRPVYMNHACDVCKAQVIIAISMLKHGGIMCEVQRVYEVVVGLYRIYMYVLICKLRMVLQLCALLRRLSIKLLYPITLYLQ